MNLVTSWLLKSTALGHNADWNSCEVTKVYVQLNSEGLDKRHYGYIEELCIVFPKELTQIVPCDMLMVTFCLNVVC